MFSPTFPRNIAAGFYPERRDTDLGLIDEYVHNHIVFPARKILSRFEKFERIVECVNRHTDSFNNMTDSQLQEEADQIRVELHTKDADLHIIAKSFAIIREFADRRINMRHYDTQLIGGWVLLHGMVAEMETGEGKTLVATLPACTAALAGIPVHIITVNDYLAQRDAELMKPVYEAMGITVGVVIHGLSLEERRIAYNCDVTYCTNKEIVFDYLKDHLALGKRPGNIQIRLERLFGNECKADNLCLRGLCYAIVDEADSILIDEARTPLIISGPGDNSFEAPVYKHAMELSGKFEPDADYLLDDVKKSLSFTDAGKTKLEELTENSSGFWSSKLRREIMMRQALTARHLFHKGKDYLVKEGKVQIIDEYTGRLMADRSWEQGLHQLIECKEECEITPQKETLARISYQRFFRRYHRLSGMTGTAREVSKELWHVYRLSVVPIVTNKTLRRNGYPPHTFINEKEKFDAIINCIRKMHEKGRPVLVGTPSVRASEQISSLLDEEGLAHRVLNAQQDKQEAEIIAEAGKKGQITVATNMAGRGTDIKLEEGVPELGGLHVIATERHNARRIDRQLFGRCGRQGDPGSFEIMSSLEDEVMKDMMKSPLVSWLCGFLKMEKRIYRTLFLLLVAYAQKAIEMRHYSIRKNLLKHDESLEKSLAFSGRGE